jgi:hypothetical protein
MKIALVYFEETLPDDRRHHRVGHGLLRGWQRFYKTSGTIARPCLLLDRTTPVPDFWEYDSVVVEDDTVERRDVLNKVGWIKAQAHALLGQCVVMDIDALLHAPIDDLASLPCPLAMAPDYGTDLPREWAADWPAAAKKYNAGVLYLNSPAVLPRFREVWAERAAKYLGVTYFDEVIFSALLTELGGHVLSPDFNTIWDGYKAYPTARVIHFNGRRKADLGGYVTGHM